MVKNPPANAGDVSSIPGSGRSPGERHGNPLQYSCLVNPMDRGDFRAFGTKRVGHDLVTKQQQQQCEVIDEKTEERKTYELRS